MLPKYGYQMLESRDGWTCLAPAAAFILLDISSTRSARPSSNQESLLGQFNSSRRQFVVASAAVPVSLALDVPAALAQTKVPPVEDFVREPAVESAIFAPGGKSVLVVRPVNGRRNLAVLDIATRKVAIITNFRDVDVTSPVWINSERIVFSVLDRSRGAGDQVTGGILYAINRDSTEYRPIAGKELQLPVGDAIFHSRVRGGGRFTDEIHVSVTSLQANGRIASNLHRLNTKTARATVATLGGPGLVQSWVVDRNNIPRAAVSQQDDLVRIHFRDGAESPWRVVAEGKIGAPGDLFTPLAFDGQGVLYLSAFQGRDFAGIYRFDAKSLKVESEPLFALDGFDLEGGLVFDGDDFRLVGIRFEADRPSVRYFDKNWQALQTSIDRALEGRTNYLSGSLADASTPILVNSFSTSEPGRYLLYDQGKKQLEQIAAARPWFATVPMGRTEFIRYKARDGLSIPSQLTTPPGADRKNLPLVVLHYGGPWVRAIHGSFDGRVQFLASRGYAVFMPAPRASTGFGLRHYVSGFKQFGLTMQDDVTDGVRFLIAQGIVDPKRVCIAGASYGGYMAMMGLVKEPELFRCGVNWVGVTDPELYYSVAWTDFNRAGVGQPNLAVRLGEPDKLREQFRQTSPLHRASEIKQPVLMAYGGLDQRVPIIHGERLRDALKPHNPNVEWVVYGDEAHGFLKESTNIDFLTRVEAFLAKNLAPR